MTSSKGYGTITGDDGQTLYLIGDEYVTREAAAEYAQAEAGALAALGDPAAYEGYPTGITPTCDAVVQQPREIAAVCAAVNKWNAG